MIASTDCSACGPERRLSFSNSSESCSTLAPPDVADWETCTSLKPNSFTAMQASPPPSPREESSQECSKQVAVPYFRKLLPSPSGSTSSLAEARGRSVQQYNTSAPRAASSHAVPAANSPTKGRKLSNHEQNRLSKKTAHYMEGHSRRRGSIQTKEVEQRYRNGVKERFAELRAAVPSLRENSERTVSSQECAVQEPSVPKVSIRILSSTATSTRYSP